MALKIATLDITTERKYTLKADEKEEVKTTFSFKPLSKRQLALYKDSNQNESNTFFWKFASAIYEVSDWLKTYRKVNK